MIKRILLHVGAPKSGSTYIQKKLKVNKDKLTARNIAYPVLPKFDRIAGNAKTITIALENELGAGFRRNFPDVDITKLNAADEIKSLLALCPTSTETVILSSENMHPGHAKELVTLIPEGVDCDIVLSIRKQDDWVDSYLNHFVKNNYMASIDEAIDEILNPDEAVYYSPDWLYHYKGWNAYFENVHIVFLNDSQEDVFDQFIKLVGFESSEGFEDITAVNKSLPLNALAYLSRFPKGTPHSKFVKYRRACDLLEFKGARASDADSAPNAEVYTLLSSAQRQRLIMQFKRANDELLDILGAKKGLMDISAAAQNFKNLEDVRQSKSYKAYAKDADAAIAN